MPRSFSLSAGGPFAALAARLHLTRPDGTTRGGWLALALWLPLVLGEGARLAMGRHPDPLLRDLSVHTRLLVALPLLLFAERVLDASCRFAVESLYAGGFCEPARIDRIIARAERWRDARWPELLLAFAAFAGGLVVLWGWPGTTGFFHGGAGGLAWTVPRLWYGCVALPVVQFVLFRWLWRWSLWSSILGRFALAPLSLVATHPDFAAGLGFLGEPLSGFAGFAFGVGSVLSGAWGTQLLDGRTTVQALLPPVVIFLLCILALAVGPLLPFCGHLFRARRRGLAQYGDFASGYMRGFHAKWVSPERSGAEALGSSDIQSMNDLVGVFSVVHRTRLFVFGARPVAAVGAGALLPMVPLVASSWTVQELLKRIGSAILGGLPV